MTMNGMTKQEDSNNCGIFVTAWAENAARVGRVKNCIKIGKEKQFRKKMYDSLRRLQCNAIEEMSERFQNATLNEDEECKGSLRSSSEEIKDENSGNDERHLKVLEMSKLSKCLNRCTIVYIEKMLEICIKPYKSYKPNLLNLLSGRCKDEIVISFMNYIASKKFRINECEENDNTFWSWCKWAISKIKKEEQKTIVTSNDFKLIKTNGNIKRSVMDKYISIHEKREKGGVSMAVIIAKQLEHSKDEMRKIIEKNRYIPFLSIEDNKSQWVLIEIDINREVIVIYNPRNSDDKHEKKVLHAISNTIGVEIENEWTLRRCTSIRHQTREEESGVFVAAWIKAVIYDGEVNNCIGASQVKIFRSEIYNDLKVRTYGKDRGEEVLDAVLQYRKTFINSTEEVKGSIPEEILKVQTEYLKAITRHLVLMKG